MAHIDLQIGDILIIQKDVFLMSLERDSRADVQVEEERVQRRAGKQFFLFSPCTSCVLLMYALFFFVCMSMYFCVLN